LQGFLDGLVSQLATIRGQTLDVAWENYVYDFLKGKSGAARERRSQLVLDLSKQTDPVPLPELRYISPRVAELYSRKSQKVIYNDVKELISEGLIVQGDKGVEANRKIILAFLPSRKR
jgi:hypothetical protein